MSLMNTHCLFHALISTMNSCSSVYFASRNNIQNFIEWFEMFFLWISVIVHVRSLGTMTQNHCKSQLGGPIALSLLFISKPKIWKLSLFLLIFINVSCQHIYTHCTCSLCKTDWMVAFPHYAALHVNCQHYCQLKLYCFGYEDSRKKLQ